MSFCIQFFNCFKTSLVFKCKSTVFLSSDQYSKNVPKNPVRSVKEQDQNAEFRYVILSSYNALGLYCFHDDGDC